MKALTNMMGQLVAMQRQNAEATMANNQQQQIIEVEPENINNENRHIGQVMRQASVKEIANTLPEFDPSDENAISVNQFIDRVNKVVDAYQ
ncbi:hypothetical protein KR215_001217, partial [Drosophila sulfurigaster]